MQFIIGVGVGLVIVLALYFVPALSPPVSRQARDALEQAELARRELHWYAKRYALPLLARRVEPQRLAGQDAAGLLERAPAEFGALAQEFAQLVARVRQQDRRLKQPATELRALQADPAELRAAIAGLERAYRRQEELLRRAARDAQQARQAGRELAAPAQVLGMAEMLRAARLLDEAGRLRSQLAGQQARLLALGAEWKLTRAEADHYAGLEVSQILAGLRGDRQELEALRGAAVRQAESLAAAVGARQEQLAGLRRELEQARQAQLELARKGFEAGKQESFEAYRARYRELSARLSALQAQEQLLASGGRRDAEFQGEDLQTAPIAGGQAVAGLEELKRRLAIAQEQARRYVAAAQALDERIEAVKARGRRAQQEQARYAARLEELRPAVEAAQAEAGALAEAAYKKEAEALEAAQAAVRAFGESGRALAAWIGAARQVQRAEDPEGKNERLGMIVGDAFVRRLAEGARAAGQMLIARIHAQRVDAIGGYLGALERFAAAYPGSTFDRRSLRAAIEDAREQGIRALNESRQAYEKLASGRADWIPRSSAAVAEYLLSKLDPGSAAQHLSAALEHIRGAVSNPSFPYVKEQVAFLEHLRQRGGQGEAPAGKPEQGGAE